MNENEESLTIRRIVVALDASPNSEAALEAALQIAAQFEAELRGVYVEDVDVLRIAQLPFAQEVGGHSARSRHMDLEEIERRFRARTRTIRRTFRTRSRRAAVEAAFRVVRDQIESALRDEAAEADLLIVGRSGWAQRGELRLGSTARLACCVDLPDLMTLVLHHGAKLRAPYLNIYDGSARARRALHMGAQLAESNHLPLEVLLIADHEDEIRVQQDEVRDELKAHDVPIRFHVLTDSNVMRLVDAIQRVNGGTLIVPARAALIAEDEAMMTLLEDVDIPVLLVR